MLNLSIKVELYMGRSVAFEKEVLLRDNGDDNGTFISEWNITDKPKPSLDQLNAFEDEAIKVDDNNKIIAKRVIGYGSIGEQLDMKYWDEVNKTSKWFDHIKAVKAGHPKKE